MSLKKYSNIFLLLEISKRVFKKEGLTFFSEMSKYNPTTSDYTQNFLTTTKNYKASINTQ